MEPLKSYIVNIRYLSMRIRIFIIINNHNILNIILITRLEFGLKITHSIQINSLLLVLIIKPEVIE